MSAATRFFSVSIATTWEIPEALDCCGFSFGRDATVLVRGVWTTVGGTAGDAAPAPQTAKTSLLAGSNAIERGKQEIGIVAALRKVWRSNSFTSPAGPSLT